MDRLVALISHMRNGALTPSIAKRAEYGVKCAIGALIRSLSTVAAMSTQRSVCVSRNETTARCPADGAAGSGNVSVAGMLKLVPSGRKSNTMPWMVAASGSVAVGLETATVMVTS